LIYQEYDVDCEYTREGYVTKYINGDCIYPDVIVVDATEAWLNGMPRILCIVSD